MRPSNFIVGVLIPFGWAILWCGYASAGDLVYQPRNPAFGGSPFTGDFLLSSAQTQNQFQGNGKRFESDPIADFSETLQRRLLSELSRDITDAIFGEEAQDSGTFTVESTTIAFERIGDQVEIVVDDGAGSSTTITLPVVEN